MRVVLDTNVLVRALMNPTGTWGEVVSRSGEYTLVISPTLEAELIRVVRLPRLSRRFGRMGQAHAIERARAILANALTIVDPPIVPVCRDSEDDKFFACALAGQAECIVSEDDDVLAIPEYEGIRTVRAVTFLRLLDEARS